MFGPLQTWMKDRKDDQRVAEKEKQEKLVKHYREDVRVVLDNWLGIQAFGSIYLGEVRHDDGVSLLLNIIHEMRKLDKYEEVVTHLRTGYSGEKISSLYKQLEEEEKTHNAKVLKFYEKLQGIHEDITSVTSLELFDREKQRKLYYSFELITKYISNSAEKQFDRGEVLRVVPYDNDSYAVTHRNIGGNLAEGKENDMACVKNYLESEHTTSKIREHQDHLKNIKRIGEIKKQLNDEIEHLVHEADRSGLLGTCVFEDALKK